MNRDSAETTTTGRMIPSGTNSPPAETPTTGRMIPSINISNEPCQRRSNDYWADDTLED